MGGSGGGRVVVQVVVAALAWLAGPRPATAAPTVVALTFDDGWADQIDARPILAAHNFKATFFIISAKVNQVDYLTLAQLRTLAADGHEIGGHTLTHPDLALVLPDQARSEICDDLSALRGWGFAPTTFAYPFGSLTGDVAGLAQGCGYLAARSVGGLLHAVDCPLCDAAESLPPVADFAIRAPSSIKSTTALADLQQQVLDAESAGGGLVPLVMHHVCDGCDPYAITATTLEDFCDWLALRAGRGTVVRTMAAALGKRAPPPPPPRPPPPPANLLVNPSLEADQDNDKLPDCWMTGGFGQSTFSIARIADPYSGAWASRLQVTAWSSGDRKLVQTLDNGPCAPPVAAGQKYTMGAFYKSNAPTAYVAFYRDANGAWQYWFTSGVFPAAGGWSPAQAVTPPVPAGATRMAFGLRLQQVGGVTSDDYSLTVAP